jgi:hypothetical protein
MFLGQIKPLIINMLNHRAGMGWHRRRRAPFQTAGGLLEGMFQKTPKSASLWNMPAGMPLPRQYNLLARYVP